MPSYRDANGRSVDASSLPGTKLLWIWSSRCPHCRSELAALDLASDRFRTAGVRLLALSVDALDGDMSSSSAQLARDTLRSARSPFEGGWIDAESFERLEMFQRALFDKTVPSTVPLMFLVDGAGRALAIYRGRVSIDGVLSDARETLSADDRALHHLAPPMSGTWFTQPVADADMAEFLARQFQERLPEDALPYLHLAAESSTGSKKSALRRELATRCHVLARDYERRQDPETSAFYFEGALSSAPSDAEIHCDYAQLLGSYGILEKAQEHFQRALELKPGMERARQGLKLIRDLPR